MPIDSDLVSVQLFLKSPHPEQEYDLDSLLDYVRVDGGPVDPELVSKTIENALNEIGYDVLAVAS